MITQPTTATRILGIESSCDETAAAVVADGRTILSSVVASQIDIHRKYGGVVPELASREHLRQIVPVVREALEQAHLQLRDLNAIGVTQGPGLVGSLLVGITYGKTLAAALNKPLIAVNHLEGHIHAAFLEAYRTGASLDPCSDSQAFPKLPAVCLIVSGGHTVLYEVRSADSATDCCSTSVERADPPLRQNNSLGGRSFSSDINSAIPAEVVDLGFSPGREAPLRNPARSLCPDSPLATHHSPLSFSYRKLGQTRDDAAGEAYDKVSKLLGLGYPGGPILDRLASAAGNTPPPVKFGPTKTRGNPLDFSFSGLKTAVLYHLREHPEYNAELAKREEALHSGHRRFEELLPLCTPQTLALIREFQNAVVRDLVERTFSAAESCEVETILVSGGVAANSQLRATFNERAVQRGLKVFFPSRALSTDNAAMIAAAAYPRFLNHQFADITLNASASLPLA